jgi:gamma-glutamyltranspeptidase/glutathione hydrolase
MVLEKVQDTDWGCQWNYCENLLTSQNPDGCELLKSDDSSSAGRRAPKEGEIMKNPTLAETLKLLGENGKDGFYKGQVAKSIIESISARGGALQLDDFSDHAARGSEETEPISLTFTAFDVNKERGGLKVWEHPPNGQGIIALMALGILQELEKSGKLKKWKSSEHNSVPYLHTCIEALRLALADASWYVADPSVVKVPIAELISSEYLAERAKLFSPSEALPQDLPRGSPAVNPCDTVYFAVTDAAGNGCSFINSVFSDFGTGIVPSGCGFTLQARGANFSLDADHPNVYAPSKRPYHTIIPGLATNVDDGSLASVFGVMGGFMQPQGHLQVLLNQYVFGMSVQDALDAPRFCVGPGMLKADGTMGEVMVSVEEGIGPEILDGLKQLGHTVRQVTGYERSLFGRGQIIRVEGYGEDLIYSAGSDPRADGAAMPVV